MKQDDPHLADIHRETHRKRGRPEDEGLMHVLDTDVLWRLSNGG
jgi:hypothetical protein